LVEFVSSLPRLGRERPVLFIPDLPDLEVLYWWESKVKLRYIASDDSVYLLGFVLLKN
jgi:hypothetical protein